MSMTGIPSVTVWDDDTDEEVIVHSKPSTSEPDFLGKVGATLVIIMTNMQ